MPKILDVLYRVQKLLWRVLRPRTRGVKVMLLDEAGSLLLIRNSYGRSDLWVLVGGGIRPFETPERAAHREVREEIGCGVAGMVLRSTHLNRAEGKRDQVFLFEGRLVGCPAAASFEVAEVGLFPPDALPESVSAATRRRIEEYRGLREPDGAW
jgi:8-oxo-dGTP pyrophosphatase MutT (NUDIX family)